MATEEMSPERIEAAIARIRAKVLEGADVFFELTTSRTELHDHATLALSGLEQLHLRLAAAGALSMRDSMEAQVRSW